MKVKLKVSRAGQEANGQTFSQAPGDIIEVDEGLGQRMIEAGQAELVEGGKAAKTGSSEKAVKTDESKEEPAKTESDSEVKPEASGKPARKGKARKAT